MKRLVGAAALMAAFAGPAAAQSWVPWYTPQGAAEAAKNRRAAPVQPQAKAKPKALLPGQTLARQGKASAAGRLKPGQQASLIPMVPASLSSDDDDDAAPPRYPSAKQKPKPLVPAVLEGGPRPPIAPSAPPTVTLHSGYGAGTVVIDTSRRKLYLVQSGSTALAYPISVGRDGFRWTGTEKISRVANWPDWRPPAEMRERQPNLPEVMTGGVRNPLGAKALYLGNSLYRIHGTNSAQTIGQANSSGCFRMMNSHVVDLAGRVGVGTTVVVKSKL